MACVDPYTDVRDHTLLTTVEPARLSRLGASIQARVGTVVHAGLDPYAGATTIVLDNHQTRLHQPVFAAEDESNWRDEGAILLLLFYLDALPNPRVVEAFRKSAPERVEHAESRRDGEAVSDAATASGCDDGRHALR